APGLNVLEITWNASATEGEPSIDDRYASARREYRIPFLFNPDFELELEAATGRTGWPKGDPGEESTGD
ncbi:hypothetical protein V6O07_17810, partial [Arthrospira platensis SPKY2]